MKELKQSPVVFDQEAHSYHLEGVILMGVTTLMRNQLFKDKYKDVPEFVMERAKERGTLVHEQCELVDSLGVEPAILEAQNYVKIKKQFGLTTIANEYLISDEEHFASSIDVVFENESEEICLTDIKTTSKLDVEWLRWQLSIYAFLFEKQNPGMKVKHLYGLWLRGEVNELKEVQRIDDDTVHRMMECEVNGEAFMSDDIPLPDSVVAVPPEAFERIVRILSLDSQIKSLTEEKKRLSEELYQYMEDVDETKYESDNFTVSRVLPTTKKALDTKGLEKNEPEIYKLYVKETVVKGSVRITAKKMKE